MWATSLFTKFTKFGREAVLAKDPVYNTFKSEHMDPQEVIYEPITHFGANLQVTRCDKRGYRFIEFVDYPLLHAVRNRDAKLLKACVEEGGAAVNANGNWALRTATAQGYFEMVKLLVSLGARVEVVNDIELFVAVAANHVEVVKLLLSVRDPLEDDLLRLTLTNAVRKGHSEMLTALLNAPRDSGWNFSNNRFVGSQPLERAAEIGNVDSVRILLGAGVVPTPNALEYACEGGHAEIVRVFIEADADFVRENIWVLFKTCR
ncbi:hypothetical protein HK102_013326 [Quaeritorhiza haematococci]|nr:hypothetical protein HK102_013326 [Quaeritorhiza haematococci]